jgi:hypothetical protein
VIAVGGNQTVNEGATVTILNFASDADPGTALSFSLGGGSPSGATIHPGSGTVTWLTGEGNGPSTNTVIIVVTDNGVPPLSATGFVSVVVNEVNVAPAMAFITNRVVNEGAFVSVQPSVSDADVPANAFTWSLSGSVPEGAAVDAASGLFTWTPNSTQGPSTNTIQIVATDNGVPALSATQRFTIVVRNTEGDFKLSIGTTNVYAGASGTVPLTIQSSTDITNLTVGLEVPQARLTNLMLSSVAPELSSSVLVPNGTDRSELRFVTAAGQVLDSAQTLAWLAFGTVPNTNSAIVPLDLFAVLAVRSTGAVLTNGVAFDGRVFLVGNQPLLDAEPGSRLALYGHTGGTYTVEFSTNLPALTWSNAASVTLTGAVHRFTVEHTNYPALFFRARQE